MFDFQQGGMILKKYLPILKNSPFFTGLTDNEILSILHCVKATAVSQKRDSYIFRAGDSTEVMVLLVSRNITGKPVRKELQKAAGDCFSVQKTWQNLASCIFRGENGMVSSWCLNIG